MSELGHDLQAVHRAAHDLTRAVADLEHVAGAHVDVRRLVEDVRRVHADLELLGIHAPPRDEEPIAIPDEDYPPEFFADAHDEGIGRH